MSRRRLIRRVVRPAVLLAVVVSAAGCTHLGVGDGIGAKTSTVVYSVTGNGSATVAYAATATATMTTLKDASLPFNKTVHTLDHPTTMYKITATSGHGTLRCTITVNGVRVITQSAAAGHPLVCSFLK